MSKLRVFVSRLSQPSRAVLIFCLANGIDAEEVEVDMAKGEHQKPEYKTINPMGQVPAIDDNGFCLFESQAILRYLATAYPNVKEHWYPLDVKKRAQLDCVLDWHHSNLRRGSAGLVRNRVILPLFFGLPFDAKAASDCEGILINSLNTMENLWLREEETFLTGNPQPSIADLSLACEVMQLQFLGEETMLRFLDPCPKVKMWLHSVEKALSPHYKEVHETLRATAAGLANTKEGGIPPTLNN